MFECDVRQTRTDFYLWRAIKDKKKQNKFPHIYLGQIILYIFLNTWMDFQKKKLFYVNIIKHSLRKNHSMKNADIQIHYKISDTRITNISHP